MFRPVTKVGVEVMSMQTQPTGTCLTTQLAKQLMKRSHIRGCFFKSKNEVVLSENTFFMIGHIKKKRGVF